MQVARQTVAGRRLSGVTQRSGLTVVDCGKNRLQAYSKGDDIRTSIKHYKINMCTDVVATAVVADVDVVVAAVIITFALLSSIGTQHIFVHLNDNQFFDMRQAQVRPAAADCVASVGE